jgi:hypothetical protein
MTCRWEAGGNSLHALDPLLEQFLRAIQAGSVESVNGVPHRRRVAGAAGTCRAWCARVALLLCAWISTGCTLIGLGIGTSVPQQEEFRGPVFEAPSDSTVTAYLVPGKRYPDRLCGTEAEDFRDVPQSGCGKPIMLSTVTGTFRGSHDDHIWIERDGFVIGLKSTDVDHLSRETSYWAEGAIAGAVVDAITWVVAATVIAHNSGGN